MAKAKPPKTVNPGLPEVDEGSPNHLRRAQISVAQYSGPLPPASELERYEEVCPGAAKVILEAFQAETNHRHEMDKKYFDLDKSTCLRHSFARPARLVARLHHRNDRLVSCGMAGLPGEMSPRASPSPLSI